VDLEEPAETQTPELEKPAETTVDLEDAPETQTPDLEEPAEATVELEDPAGPAEEAETQATVELEDPDEEAVTLSLDRVWRAGDACPACSFRTWTAPKKKNKPILYGKGSPDERDQVQRLQCKHRDKASGRKCGLILSKAEVRGEVKSRVVKINKHDRPA